MSRSATLFQAYAVLPTRDVNHIWVLPTDSMCDCQVSEVQLQVSVRQLQLMAAGYMAEHVHCHVWLNGIGLLGMCTLCGQMG